jgi:hypothetical protein
MQLFATTFPANKSFLLTLNNHLEHAVKLRNLLLSLASKIILEILDLSIR